MRKRKCRRHVKKGPQARRKTGLIVNCCNIKANKEFIPDAEKKRGVSINGDQGK